MIFPRVPRLHYFKSASEIEDFSNLKILDFGGNRGNLLEDGAELKEIDPRNYTCIDVDKEALEFGAKRFPDATWKHYDPLNWHYNPTGKTNLILPLESNSFDLICAYSVHSHTTFEMLMHDLAEMFRVCKPGGKIVTTLLTKNMMQWFMHKRKMNYNVSSDISIFSFDNVEDYVYYIDDGILTKSWNQGCNQFLAVYNEQWLLDQIPYASSIKTHILKKVRDTYQSALVIQKTS